jgi:hypothetical protein
MHALTLGARLIYGFRRRASGLNKLLTMRCRSNSVVARIQLHQRAHFGQPRSDPGFKCIDVFRYEIARYDDLLARAVQLIDG